jgi:hypothetical protein
MHTSILSCGEGLLISLDLFLVFLHDEGALERQGQGQSRQPLTRSPLLVAVNWGLVECALRR